MAKVLFIQPHKIVLSSDLDKGDNTSFMAERTDRFARANPSISAMCVLGALSKHHKPYFIDATADNPDNIFPFNSHVSAIGMSDDELCDKISDIKPDLVLITSMFTTEYFIVNHISRLIKDNFGLPIVVGGHQAALRPAWHLDEGHVDVVALGEGELNINDIIDGIEKRIPLSHVEGIVYKNRKLIEQPKTGILHTLDQPWDIKTVVKKEDGYYRYPNSLVIRNPRLYMPEGTNPSEGSAILYASRGCPNACDYCNATNRDGRKIRHMSLDKMIELTEEFIAMGANTFHNQSDTLGVHLIDREYFDWVGEQRKQEREINLANANGFFAKYFFPNNKFSQDRVELLKKAGFKTITIALESFNERFNKGKLKGLTIEMLNDCFAHIQEQGLNVDIYMMYLFPGQTNKELATDINNINRLSGNTTTTTWRSLTYFPGTAYYDWAIKTGKFTEQSYKEMIQKGHSFYHPDHRFNFSAVKNPPSL